MKDGNVRPHNVYLDQSAYGRILDDAADWHQSEIGKVLIAAQSRGEAQVWAGPTNVIETIQASDPARRKALASMTLELIEVKRMWCGFEYEAIDDFVAFLKRFVPKAIRFPEYFENHVTVSQQTWLGVLGLAASVDGSHFGPVVKDLEHTKAVNRLLHAKFALAPEEWVANMIEAAESLETTAEDPLADMVKLSTDQITDEIDRLAKDAVRLPKPAAQDLDQKRAMIARAYGTIEIGGILNAVFRLPLELSLTFDISEIVANWDQIRAATGCEPLPEGIRTRDTTELGADPDAAITVLQHALRAAARKGLLTGSLAVQIILREMQRWMNNVQVPTGGLAFDADHGTALKRHDILITHDKGFANSLNALANRLSADTAGKWRPQIVMTAKQLEHALKQ